jgi:hypothetical protein
MLLQSGSNRTRLMFHQFEVEQTTVGGRRLRDGGLRPLAAPASELKAGWPEAHLAALAALAFVVVFSAALFIAFIESI